MNQIATALPMRIDAPQAVDKYALDVKVVQCEDIDASDRWRELVLYLLEIDQTQ